MKDQMVNQVKMGRLEDQAKKDYPANLVKRVLQDNPDKVDDVDRLGVPVK